MIRKRICVLWALLLSINFNCLVAQDTICFDLPNQYGFENIAADSIDLTGGCGTVGTTGIIT